MVRSTGHEAVLHAGARVGSRSAVSLAAVTFASMLPVTLIVPALRELVKEGHAAGDLLAHGFMSINMLAAFAAAPLIAIVSDRGRGRVRTAALALLADAGLFAAMAAAPGLTALLAARALEGVAHILALTCLMAAAADQADARRRGRTMGLVGAAMMLGTACGTRLGGVVWQLAPGWSFAAAAVLALAAALGAATLGESAERRARHSSREALRLLRARPDLLIPYAYTFVDRFCVGVIVSSFVLFLGEVRALNPDAISRLLALFLAPFALLVYPAGRLVDRVGSALPVALGSAVFGLLLTSYPLAATGALPALMVVSGVVSAIMFAPTLTLCAELSNPEQRGAAYAGFNATGSLGFLCGPLAGGLILLWLRPIAGEWAAYQTVFALAGGAQVAVALTTYPRLRQLHRRRRAVEPELDAGGASHAERR
ncbi:MAG: hypothetical protein CHACPFDD_03311 [Phycisphaerae bacterium]|nr:hypothetical protein [Phycisphaerae bacterium]